MTRDLPPLIEALLRPEAYPFRVREVRLVETHISWVLLTGEFAYKLKKPVDLGFLDFSTLERRIFACHDEVRLNRRLAPELYLGVAPIHGDADAPHVGAPGDSHDGAHEVAVCMREFPQDAQLDRIFEHGELRGPMLVDLAHRLATFHAALPPASPGTPWGEPDHVLAPMFENFDHIEPRLTGERTKRAVARLRGWTRDRADELLPLLVDRKTSGRIREGHGDLHLSNVIAHGGALVPFDCLEFSPALRWNDVISDAAFLVMDLRVRGADELAATFASAYVEESGDYEAVRLLPFYLVYRSLVRAKVAAIASGQLGALPGPGAGVAAHIELAQRIADEQRPALILMHGASGTGKTWLSEQLVPLLRAYRVRSDVTRKRLLGLGDLARTDDDLKARVYDEESSCRTYMALADAADHVLAAAAPIIVDATFLRHGRRERLIRAAQDAGAPWCIVSCSAPRSVLVERVARRAARGDDASEAGADVIGGQLSRAEALDVHERARTIIVDTSHPVYAEAVAARIAALTSPAVAALRSELRPGQTPKRWTSSS